MNLITSRDEIYQSLDLLYEAGMDPSKWSDWITNLSDILPDEVNFLMTSSRGLDDKEPMLMASFQEHVTQSFLQHYVHVNSLWPALIGQPANKPFLTDHVFPIKNIAHTEIYSDWFLPNNLTSACGMNLCTSPNQMSAVAFFYDSRQAHNLNAPLFNLFSKIKPHILRALEMNVQLAQSGSQTQTLEQFIDKFDKAAFLIGPQGKLIHANFKGDQTLRSRRGLALDMSGRINLIDSNANDKLRQQIKALNGSEHRSNDTGLDSVIGFRTLGEQGINSIYISPFSSPHSYKENFGTVMLGDITTKITALLIVTFDEDVPYSSRDIIQSLFGLGAAETQLALMLMQGLSLNDYANKRKISKETARTQLKTCFNKVRVNSQVQLVIKLKKHCSI